MHISAIYTGATPWRQHALREINSLFGMVHIEQEGWTCITPHDRRSACADALFQNAPKLLLLQINIAMFKVIVF